jgi:hypothetical protein
MPSIQDIICSLFILVAAGSFGALYRYRIRRARRSGLECGECGYLTAHASGARCPECGTPWLKGDGRTFRRSRTSLAIIQTVLLLFPAGYALGVWSEGSRPVWGGRTEHVMWLSTTQVDPVGVAPQPYVRGYVQSGDLKTSDTYPFLSNPTELVFAVCSTCGGNNQQQRPTAAEMMAPQSLVFTRIGQGAPWSNEHDARPIMEQLTEWIDANYKGIADSRRNELRSNLVRCLELDWSSPEMSQFHEASVQSYKQWTFSKRDGVGPLSIWPLGSSSRDLVRRNVPLGQAVIVLLTAGVAGVIWLRWWVVLRQHAARHESQSNVRSMNS